MFHRSPNTLLRSLIFIAQKMKFSIKDFLSKCDQISGFLRICSHLPRKSLAENFIFCAVIKVLNIVQFPVLFELFYSFIMLTKKCCIPDLRMIFFRKQLIYLTVGIRKAVTKKRSKMIFVRESLPKSTMT